MIHRIARWFPLGILSTLAFAYSLTLAPALSWANDGTDGGDLIAAAATGGVPHPTGYPLYLLFAKLFQHLPLGELAFRTNLMSAVFASLAAIFVYGTIHRLTEGSAYSALIGGLTFGLAPLVWSQAVITEVYALQSFLTAVILYQAILPEKGNTFALSRGLLVGLALGNHLTSVFLVPVLFWEQDHIHIRPDRRMIVKLAGVAIGSLIYGILPWMAMNQPPINWENPVTMDGFVRLVTGQLYQFYLSTEFALERLRGWAGLLLQQFGWGGSVLGMYALLGGRKIIFRTLPFIWIFGVQSAFALFYSSKDSYIYLIPSVLAFSVWIGLGIASLLGSFTGSRIWVPSLLSLLLLAGVVFRGIHIAGEVDASRDSRAEDFGRVALRAFPEHALIFTQDDPSTFALWYFHFALRQRTDISIAVEGLLPYPWYRQNLETTYPDLKIPDRASWGVRELSALNPTRPVCFVGYKDEPQIKCSP